MVKVLKPPCVVTEPNGMIHVDLNTICRTQKRKATVEESSLEPPQKFPMLSLQGEKQQLLLFFGLSESKELCRASTFGEDFHVRQCAMKLNDEDLLVKLSAGDLIAKDTQYHLQCLVFIYNKARERK